MGNMTDAEKRLLTVPFFSKGAVGEKLAGRFQKLQQTILNRKENDPHALNPKNVTGIWYLSGLQYEEEIRRFWFVLTFQREHMKESCSTMKSLKSSTMMWYTIMTKILWKART